MNWETFLLSLDGVRANIRQRSKKEEIKPGDPILNGLENLLVEAEETYKEPVVVPQQVLQEEPKVKMTRLPADNKPAGSGTSD